MQAIGSLYTRNPLVIKIHSFLCDLHERRKFVSFCWVPSDNEKAKGLGKRTIQLPPDNLHALRFQDYIPSIRRSTRASWQSRWDQCVADGNKLAQLKPFLGPWSSCSRWCRHLGVSLSRLRIDHTRLTYGHLMAREAPHVYACCQVRLSISNILACPAYSVSCNQFFPSLTSVPPHERERLFSSPSHLLLALRLSSHFLECQALCLIFNSALPSSAIKHLNCFLLRDARF